jgi:hypothetical protein
MASWHDQLTWASVSNTQRKMAKFRNANFFVSETGRSVGRRNVVHQFPFKNDPYVEDLGKDIDEFTITGYVIQNPDNEFDYFAERDALLSALKEEGPGLLIDPFMGSQKVQLLGKAEISESFSPGGIARFTMTFIQVKDLSSGLITDLADYTGLVDDAKTNAEGYLKDGFNNIYDAEDQPDFSVSTIQNAVNDLNEKLKKVTIGIQGAGPSQISKALDTLIEQHAEIDTDTIRDSCEMINGIIGMFNGLLSLSGQYGDIVLSQILGACSTTLRGISSGPFSSAKVGLPATGFMASTMSDPVLIEENLGRTIVEAALEIANFGDDYKDIVVTTRSRAQESANREVTVNSIRTEAILVAGSTAVRINHSSFDSANKIMTDVVGALDDHLLKLGNDVTNIDYSSYLITISNPDEFEALESFRGVFVSAMLEIGASLKRITGYKVPPINISSLRLAYNLYDDLTQESDIINRNILRFDHPGFLPQNVVLEILEVGEESISEEVAALNIDFPYSIIYYTDTIDYADVIAAATYCLP